MESLVPLSKLLLHADTMLKRPDVRVQFAEGQAGVLQLLRSASRGGDARPTINTDFAFEHSPSFQRVVGALGQLPPEGMDMALFLSGLNEPIAALLDIALEHSAEAAVRLAKRMLDTDSGGRNALHLAAASGAASVFDRLRYHVNTLNRDAGAGTDGASEGAQPVRRLVEGTLRQALAAKDQRGLTPLDWAVMRWGAPVLVSKDDTSATTMPSATAGELVELATAVGLEALALTPSVAPPQRITAPALPQRKDEDPPASDSSSTASTGGWDATPWTPALRAGGESDQETCDVHQLSPADSVDMTARRFFEEFVAVGRPVVLRGAGLGLPSRAAFAKPHFLETFGGKRVAVGAVPYANSFGLAAGGTTLGVVAELNYSDAQPGQTYAFSTAMPDWHSQLERAAPPPAWLAELLGRFHGSKETQFFLGPAGSGAPVHYHGHAVNALAYGEKRWFLQPPARGMYSKLPAEERFLREHNGTAAVPESEARPLECTQHAGDLLFVPTLWSHGTLNVRQSIGTAYEFSIEPFAME